MPISKPRLEGLFADVSVELLPLLKLVNIFGSLGLGSNHARRLAMPPVRPLEVPALLLRRSSESWAFRTGPDDYDVVGKDADVVGRVVRTASGPAGLGAPGIDEAADQSWDKRGDRFFGARSNSTARFMPIRSFSKVKTRGGRNACRAKWLPSRTVHAGGLPSAGETGPPTPTSERHQR